MDPLLQVYLTRWEAVAEIERQELLNTSMDTRWKQLNSVIGLAIALNFMKPDESEMAIYSRWAKLKENEDK